MSSYPNKILLPVVFFIIIILFSPSTAQLKADFYVKTCPSVLSTVYDFVAEAFIEANRIAASLLRLHFHDCFVNGCDASILLDNSTTIVTEKDAPPNANSARGFGLVDRIKQQLEIDCPGVVSCADLLAIAAEASVRVAGGPSWTVLLGRRDSVNAFKDLATTALPGPSESLDEIKSKFRAVGLDTTMDVVALSGGHTFGRARCRTFQDRLYNFNNTNAPDPTMEEGLLKKLRNLCPREGDGSSLNNLDQATPDIFDRGYYSSLVSRKGILNSDQELLSTPGADSASIVRRFASNEELFFKNFVKSMIRMGNIKPLTGSSGEIRKNCRRVNKRRGELVMEVVEDALLTVV